MLTGDLGKKWGYPVLIGKYPLFNIKMEKGKGKRNTV
jgi:hypothetical protein